MDGKKVSESRVTTVQQMVQSDANFAGNVHGGVIMKLIDNTGWIAANRHFTGNIVTASIDRLNFHSPVRIGDLLRVSASVNYVGRTSMEVGVRVEAENFITGEVKHTASAYLTLVVLDENGRPLPLPPVIPETEVDIKRSNEAAARKEARRKGIC